MKIKHEHIRMAMNAWARPDGEKVPAAGITQAYFELGMTFPELYRSEERRVGKEC